MQLLDIVKATLGFSEDIELANFLKKDKSTISKWRAKGEIPAKVERELNLLIATEKPAIVSEAREAYLPLSAVRIPIISYAQAGVDGFFLDSFPVGCGFGEIYCPVDVKDPNAYALIVNGDSMYPRIEQGDIVVVSPNTGVTAGDCAVVKLRGGEVLLKRVRQKNGKYILESINAEYSIIEVEKEEISFCHKIVWIKPRG